MSTNYTPGPWTIFEQYVQKPDGGMVCQWQSYTKKADARLITAAPDLYEALVRARSFIAAKVEPSEQARAPLLAIVDAAIAKAVRQERQERQ